MTSSWPIVFGVFVLIIAACWYDASVAAALSNPLSHPAPRAQLGR